MAVVNVKCPHCGNENKVHIDILKPSELQIIYCEDEKIAGCGEPFLVSATITLHPHVYTFEEVKGGMAV